MDTASLTSRGMSESVDVPERPLLMLLPPNWIILKMCPVVPTYVLSRDGTKASDRARTNRSRDSVDSATDGNNRLNMIEEII